MTRKIYFLCPQTHHPIGGIKQIYRQAELLYKHGYDAVVLQKRMSTPSWFKSAAKIEVDRYLFKQLKYLLELENKTESLPFHKRIKLWYLKRTRIELADDSILVFPEIYGDFISLIEPDKEKVVFNQNAYKTFEHITFNNRLNPYYQKKVLGALVVSSDSETYLKYCFPQFSVARIRLGIDTNIFHYHTHKKKQIIYMPRKLEHDVRQVIEILKTRTLLNDWELIPIHNMEEEKVAALMRESLLFLSFSNREGFGLPPAEAMACGCIVIGYNGGSGKEFFLDDFCYTVEEGDMVNYVATIESVINIYNDTPNILIEKGKLASEFITRTYNMENEKKDTLKFWSKMT